jgi:hypothetical protein
LSLSAVLLPSRASAESRARLHTSSACRACLSVSVPLQTFLCPQLRPLPQRDQLLQTRQPEPAARRHYWEPGGFPLPTGGVAAVTPSREGRPASCQYRSVSPSGSCASRPAPSTTRTGGRSASSSRTPTTAATACRGHRVPLRPGRRRLAQRRRLGRRRSCGQCGE